LFCRKRRIGIEDVMPAVRETACDIIPQRPSPRRGKFPTEKAPVILTEANLCLDRRLASSTVWRTLAHGGCDWNAGVPACNVAFFSDVKLRRSQAARAFSCFALMQAGTPAFQSVDVSAALQFVARKLQQIRDIIFL